ncbi:hypothetical protein ACWIG5_05240 [Streptomyces lydicus]
MPPTGRRAAALPSGPRGRADPGRRNARTGAGYAQGVDPKTRNRIMSGLLAVLLIVVAVAAALH